MKRPRKEPGTTKKRWKVAKVHDHELDARGRLIYNCYFVQGKSTRWDPELVYEVKDAEMRQNCQELIAAYWTSKLAACRALSDIVPREGVDSTWCWIAHDALSFVQRKLRQAVQDNLGLKEKYKVAKRRLARVCASALQVKIVSFIVRQFVTSDARRMGIVAQDFVGPEVKIATTELLSAIMGGLACSTAEKTQTRWPCVTAVVTRAMGGVEKGAIADAAACTAGKVECVLDCKDVYTTSAELLKINPATLTFDYGDDTAHVALHFDQTKTLNESSGGQRFRGISDSPLDLMPSLGANFGGFY